ncbi:MAG TPA: hypothetical protein VHY22_10855 [Chthoniobacteraceae bacterium]|jgi:type II secretory pathway pseudopilin PulG|nr:hypothetical protein [Chthoniobacteraceae bacterium]
MKLRRFPREAFTLVELVVSIGVLSLLVLVIAQLFNGATLTATGSRKHLDADGIARAVFDRMGSDFERILKRPDVDYDFVKQIPPGQSGSNDSMYFFSESSGYPGASGTAASTVSLVGYRINSQYQMERLGMRLAWSGTGSVPFLSYTAGGPAPDPSSTIAQNPALSAVVSDINPDDSNYYYDVIGDGVFRMEICFQLTNGTFSDKPYLSPHTMVDGTGLGDVSAIVVAIAVLDPGTKSSVPTQSVNNLAIPQLGAASALLMDFNPASQDATAPNGQPVLMDKQWNSSWQAAITNKTSGLNPVAASQVRIYQRFFYLNTIN